MVTALLIGILTALVKIYMVVDKVPGQFEQQENMNIDFNTRIYKLEIKFREGQLIDSLRNIMNQNK